MLRTRVALFGLLLALVATVVFIEGQPSNQDQVDPTVFATVEPTAVSTATPSPEQIKEAQIMLAEIFGSFDSQKACNGAYVIGTVINADQAQHDAQVYYAELLAGRKPETTSLAARQNAQTLLKVGLAACRFAPLFNELFTALAEPTEEAK